LAGDPARLPKSDFSALRPFLYWGGVVALLLIVAALVFGYRLGTWFSVGMIALAGASILYDTSKVVRRYPRDQYVAAALSLFASVGMMFWYVLRLFSRTTRS
jgi:FtsH-binding integral membrane protein